MNGALSIVRFFVPAEGQRSGAEHDLIAPVDRPPQGPALGRDRGEAGYTLIELIVVTWIISILSVIALGITNGRIEKARLARCMIDLRSIQSMVWTMSDGVNWPNQFTFWQDMWGGKRPGPYFYLTDAEDPNCGHGNDLDSFDEQNPGNSKREAKDLKFVLLCQHNHGVLANYVYIEDEGPPQLAGWDGQTNPRYDHFIKGLDKPPPEDPTPKPGGGPKPR